MSTNFPERIRAAESGSVEDMLFVGWCLLHGDGIQQNVHEAVQWWERANSLDNVEAKVRLAELYETGQYVQTDCERALRLYNEALLAPQFYGPYQFGVANYFGSSCVPRDLAKARQYFTIAAQRGHLVSSFVLGRILRSGQFGLKARLRGYAGLVTTLCRASYSLIVSPTDDEAWWDAQRWLPEDGWVGRLRTGTRFE